MKQKNFSLDDYHQILSFHSPEEIGILDHCVNFCVNGKDKFYLLSGFFKNMGDFKTFLFNGNQYVESTISLFDNGDIVLEFSTVYSDKHLFTKFKLCGNGAKVLRSKLVEERNKYYEIKRGYCKE